VAPACSIWYHLLYVRYALLISPDIAAATENCELHNAIIHCYIHTVVELCTLFLVGLILAMLLSLALVCRAVRVGYANFNFPTRPIPVQYVPVPVPIYRWLYVRAEHESYMHIEFHVQV